MRTNLILPVSAALSLSCSVAAAQNVAAAPDVAAAQDAAAAGGDSSLETGLDSFYDMMSPVVTTATKDARRVEEVPSIITVITRRQMREWNYNTVAEALKHLLGFYVVDDQVTPNIAVRGVSGGYNAQSGIVKVLIDGSPVSFRPTSGNWLGANLIPISAVDHIEIIRGPGSALYGADAFLGVINIITRSESADNVDATLGANWHSSNSAPGPDADLSASAVFDKLKILVAGRVQSEDKSGYQLSMPPIFNTTNVVTANLPNYAPNRTESTTGQVPSQVGLLKLTYDVDDTTITAMGYLSAWMRVDEFANLEQLANGIDPQGRLSQNRVSNVMGLAELQVRSKLSDMLELNVMLSYFGGGPRNDNRMEINSDYYYVERQYGYEGGEGTVEARLQPTESFTLTLGVNGFYDNQQLMSNLDIAKLTVLNTAVGQPFPNSGIQQGHKLFANIGGYAQAMWTIVPRYLTVAVGLRDDYHNIYKQQPSAQVGIMSEPLDRTYLKALYGTAFKAPTALLLYGAPAHQGDIIGNSKLLAQRVHTFEVELSKKVLDFINVSTGLSFSLLYNLAEFTPNGSYEIAANLASLKSLSWETQARLLLPEDTEAYVLFELNKTTRESGESGYVSDLLGSTNFVYPMAQVHAGVIKTMPNWHLQGMLDAQYISPRNATDDNIIANGGQYSLDGYVDVGIGLSTHGLAMPGSKATVASVAVRNLNNNLTPDPGYHGVDYPRAPLTVFASLRQEF